ncbi:ABC transporter ATP-binding protein [Fusobacterium varium]|uniref:ABC transporter ATP-binding protein n=1 Tax=Fusobacterium varium TaxID=856 RepID=UPI0035627573
MKLFRVERYFKIKYNELSKKERGIHMFKEEKIGMIYFAGKHKYLLITGCILSGISALIMMCPFILLWKVVQEVLKGITDISKINAEEVIKYGQWALLTAVGGFTVYFAALMCTHIAAFYTAFNMKSKALRHMSELPLGYFIDNPSGKLRKIIDENSKMTESFIAHLLPDLTGALTTFVAMPIILLIFDWRLGIICLIPLGIGFFIQFKSITGESVKYIKQYQDSLEKMNNEAVEYVRGIPVVKVFQQTVYSFKSFYDTIMEYKKFVIKFCQEFKNPMTSFITVINGTFILLIPAGIILIKSSYDPLKFLQNFIFYILFIPLCSMMINKIMYIGEAKSVADESVNRIVSLLEEKKLEKSQKIKLPENYTIEFCDVSFTYKGKEKPAVNKVSFFIPQGTATALVGESGSGKTTAAALIPRFWDIDDGKILIGGIDIKEIEISELMKMVSFVFQDIHLFKRSILENIRISKPEASLEKVMEAVKAAQCEEIIKKFPDGIETIIGAKGVYLSGGEMQRIAIASAILKDSPIIILDEATAFADPENEHKIQAALEFLTKNKTVVMIAHRLSTIKNADQILVLKDGKVIEKGKHNTLIEIKGMYAEMWKNYQTSVKWDIRKESEKNA